MRILLDECVTKKLKKFLKGHAVLTVTEMKWNGLKNGNLLTKAVVEKFDLVITIDKNIAKQQNMKNYDIAVVVFNSDTSRLNDLQKFIPIFEKQLSSFAKKKMHLLEL
jgi:hypothetical protein